MISRDKASDIMGRCRGRRIVVVGDLMLDRYVIGNVSRLSPEAPVPVVCAVSEQAKPGGAANVALNIQAWGAEAVVAGIVGRDQDGDELLRILRENGIRTDGVLVSEAIRTTVKTRIIAERQQVVRVDREDPPERVQAVIGDFCGLIRRAMAGAHGVLLEDYGKGALVQAVVDTVMAGARAGRIPVGLDPKDNHELVTEGLTLATPNYKEACFAAGLREVPLRGDLLAHENLRRAGEILKAKWQVDFLAITLGSHGMYLLPRDRAPSVIPTLAREVFDVTGAGDTVIATAMMAIAAGADYVDAALLANCAAGVVVGKLGAATCTPQELLESIGS